jgi:predicted 2-oxoglutarate/Fe(II)-dependent dioxygenase YbiX
VVEVSQQYDGDCKPKFQTGALCSISLTVPRTMSPPVYVYYELNNAYFNHRRMVLSRSDAQLRGDEDIADSLLKTCAPQQFQGGNGALRVMAACCYGACMLAVRLCHRS